jgi:hypothetical protein
MSGQQFQPYYLAYARAHGRSPEEMLQADRAAYPGGRMAGYLVWIGSRVEEWRKLNGRARHDSLSSADRQAFGAWLSEVRP